MEKYKPPLNVKKLKNTVEEDPSQIEELADFLTEKILDLALKLQNLEPQNDFSNKVDKATTIQQWIEETEKGEDQKRLFYDLVNLYQEMAEHKTAVQIKDIEREIKTQSVKYRNILQKIKSEGRQFAQDCKNMPLGHLEFLENYLSVREQELQRDWESNAPSEVLEVYNKLRSIAPKYAYKLKSNYISEIERRLKQVQGAKKAQEGKNAKNKNNKKEEFFVPMPIEEEFRLQEKWISSQKNKPNFKIIFYNPKTKMLSLVFYEKKGKKIKKYKEDKTIDEVRKIIIDGGYSVYDASRNLKEEQKDDKTKIEESEKPKEDFREEDEILAEIDKACKQQDNNQKSIRELLEDLGFGINAHDIEGDFEYNLNKEGNVDLKGERRKITLEILETMPGMDRLSLEEKEMILDNTASILDAAVEAEAENDFSRVFKHHKKVLVAGGAISLVAGAASIGFRMLGGDTVRGIVEGSKIAAGAILGSSAGLVRAWAKEKFNPVLDKIKQENAKKFEKIKQEKASEILTQDNIKIILAQEARRALANKLIINPERISKKLEIQEYKMLAYDFIDNNEELESLDENKKEQIAKSLAVLARVSQENSQLLVELLEEKIKDRRLGEKTRAVLRGGIYGSLFGVANTLASAPGINYIFSGAIGGLAIGGIIDAKLEQRLKNKNIKGIIQDIKKITSKVGLNKEESTRLKAYLESGVLDKNPIMREKARDALSREFLWRAIEEIEKINKSEKELKKLEEKLNDSGIKKVGRKALAYTVGVAVGVGLGGLREGVAYATEKYFDLYHHSEKSSEWHAPKEIPDHTKLALWHSFQNNFLPNFTNLEGNTDLKEDIHNVFNYLVDESNKYGLTSQKRKVLEQLFAQKLNFSLNPSSGDVEGFSSKEAKEYIDNMIEVLSQDKGDQSTLDKLGVEQASGESVSHIIKADQQEYVVEIKGKIDTFSEAIDKAVHTADSETQNNFIHKVLGNEVEINDKNRSELIKKAIRELSASNNKMDDKLDVENLVYKGNKLILYKDGTWEVQKGSAAYEAKAVSEQTLRGNAQEILKKQVQKELRVKSLNDVQVSGYLDENFKPANYTIEITEDNEKYKIEVDGQGHWTTEVDGEHLEGNLDRAGNKNKLEYLKQKIQEAINPLKNKRWENIEIYDSPDGLTMEFTDEETPTTRLISEIIETDNKMLLPLKVYYIDFIEDNGSFDEMPDSAFLTTNDNKLIKKFRIQDETTRQFIERINQEAQELLDSKAEILASNQISESDLKKYGLDNIYTEPDQRLEAKINFIKEHQGWEPKKIKAYFKLGENKLGLKTTDFFQKSFDILDNSFYDNPPKAKIVLNLYEDVLKGNNPEKSTGSFVKELLNLDPQGGGDFKFDKNGFINYNAHLNGFECRVIININTSGKAKIGIDGPWFKNIGTSGWGPWLRPDMDISVNNLKYIQNQLQQYADNTLGISEKE